MIIKVKHCFVPIELPDDPTNADIEEVMKKYNDYFDYYGYGGTDAIRMRFDTLACVDYEIRNAIWEVKHEV